jgi:hypothetical protein
VQSALVVAILQSIDACFEIVLTRGRLRLRFRHLTGFLEPVEEGFGLIDAFVSTLQSTHSSLVRIAISFL